MQFTAKGIFVRFKSKRTIPGKSKKVFKLFFRLFLLLTFTLIVAGGARSLFLLINNGSEAIRTRLAHVLKMDVELEKISLSYPNVISLHSLNIKKKGSSLFKSKRIDCRFTWQVLQGIIHFQDIAFADAYVNIHRQEDTFNFSREALPKFIKRLSNNPSQREYTLDPTKWPVAFTLRTVHFENCTMHLTDARKEVPSLNGIFNIDLNFSDKADTIYPQQGTIIIKKSAFSHNGLSGTLQGSVDLVKNLASLSLSINLTPDNSIKLHGAIRDYLTNPVCKFALDGYQIDFSFFESLLFPFMPPQTNLKVDGEMQFTDSALYNTIIPSITGKFSFENGRWVVEPVQMELSGNGGTISGGLIFDAAVSDPLRSWDKDLKNYGRIRFMLTGSTLPANPFLETLHTYADKTSAAALSSLEVELGIQNQHGKLYIASASINSDHGALIVEGKMDPQLTDLEMTGTYSIPKLLTSMTQRTVPADIKVQDNEIIVPVQIKGSFLNPEIITPQAIQVRDNQKVSETKILHLKNIIPHKKKRKKQ